MKRPKLKRLKKLVPKVPTKFIPGRSDDAAASDAENPLRITNETVAEHREKVLSRARKYIYPLQHSKHKIVLVSTGLFVTALIGFFTYCTLALYRFKATSDFLYGVTQVIPFPVAKAGDRYVSYENYLFELRHYIHYYETQQKLDFNSKGKQQLADYKKKALAKVIDDAYVKQLASKYKVSVSSKELNDQITIVRNQNRLGANEKGFEDVLKDNFGWSVNDFRRELKQQMLAQKVVAVLDTGTQGRAQAALAELNAGADFAATAKKYSEDVASKDTGGDYGIPVDRTNRDITARVTDVLFTLQPGQISGIINAGYALEIVKNIEPQGDKIHAAHIRFYFQDVGVYIKELKATKKPSTYIGL